MYTHIHTHTRISEYRMRYIAKIRIHASFNSHDSRMLYDSRKYEKKYFYKYLLYCTN